jgi:hypothetical protein
VKAFDLQVDFFLPVWRRIAVVAVCAVWSVFEFIALAPFWGVVFGAIGIYAVWQFFFDGWPHNTTPVVPPEANSNAKAAPEASDKNSDGS